MKGENGITKVVAESNYNYSYNNLKDYSDRNDMRGRELSSSTSMEQQKQKQQLGRRLLQKEEGIENVVWMDGWILNEPWQYDSNEDWVAIVNEVQNLLTGILFLLVVRRILIHLLRTRYRSNSID